MVRRVRRVVAVFLACRRVVYAAVILYTRVVGLRSFSKMSSFDFAMRGSGVTRGDLLSKLREANVLRFEDVRGA